MLQDNATELAKLQAELKTNYPQAFATFAVYRANQLLEEKPVRPAGGSKESEKLAKEVLTENPNSFQSLKVLAKVKLAEDNFVQADSLITEAIKKAKLLNARQWRLNELTTLKKKIAKTQ